MILTREFDYPWLFGLYRRNDVSDVTGEGLVAYGTQYADGSCSLSFRGETSSLNSWLSLERLKRVHCHGGHSEIVWFGRRVLVTGSRNWNDRRAVEDVLDDQLAAHGWIVVVHGDCGTGADAIASAWAQRHRPHVQEEPHPADWYGPCVPTCDHGPRKPGRDGSYCPAAGPRRNIHMVDLGADVCLAFLTPTSVGGAHCAQAAEAAGIEVVGHGVQLLRG